MAAAEPIVDDFLYEVGQLERQEEIKRVLRTLKLNPFELLGVSFEANLDEITRVYRQKSLLCHPDKAAPELREDAQKAFQLLAAAKADLLNEEKRSIFNSLLDDAKGKVNKKREEDEQAFAKKFKKENPGKEQPAYKHPTSYEEMLKIQMNEALVDAEWRRRQFLKLAAQEEGKAEMDADRRKREREEKEKMEKDWEDGRERRVVNWRDFTGKIAKKQKLAPRKTPDAVVRKIFHNDWEADPSERGAAAAKAKERP